MIALILAASQPALIETIDVFDKVVAVDSNSIAKYSLRPATYTCDMKSYEGESYQFRFSRTGGEAFLTGNKRIPIGRKPALVVMLSNNTPYPLNNPTNVYASEILTNLSYDNPGYVKMDILASRDYAYLTFRPGTTDDAGNPVTRTELYGKCAIEVFEQPTPSAAEKQK